MAEKQYIQLVDTWGGHVAEFCEEYELGPKKVPMYTFYNAAGRLFCIKQTEAVIISEKEYFILLLAGSEVFIGDV